MGVAFWRNRVKRQYKTKRPSTDPSIDNNILSLRRPRCLGAILPIKYGPSVLVQLDVDNNNVAGMNADGHARTVRLVPLDTVDMNDPLLPVHLRNLAIAPLVFPSDNSYFIILPDRK